VTPYADFTFYLCVLLYTDMHCALLCYTHAVMLQQIGDAAHSMTASVGQGVNSALESAQILCTMLGCATADSTSSSSDGNSSVSSAATHKLLQVSSAVINTLMLSPMPTAQLGVLAIVYSGHSVYVLHSACMNLACHYLL
jgi:2-polyprenyl-6-methoxyphenol hydroxylase-like FAD-dependent oxidoreductase